jgi:signal transduction histidine kinase
MSLFIETLFRKSHFDQGRLSVRTKPCNMKKDVLQPQLDRYSEQLKKMGISIDDRISGIPDSEIITVVDVGLIAQVYANLFSNAVKYTQKIITETGEEKKYISYGHELIRDFFGPGKDAVKLNVFSTGPHIAPEERSRLFDEEFRASNVLTQPGTGHGLSFIKNAVEIHGGIVGYEATQYGNNFYFILPK